MQDMPIRANASSLIKNILKFFSKQNAYVQEILQNCRRAEATLVQVSIYDDHIVIKDNGEGVYKPEELVTIGGSNWRDDIAKESPAGMGLFSAFKVASVVEVRSGRWKLSIDYDACCKGKHPRFETSENRIDGTEVTLYVKTMDEYSIRTEEATWYNSAQLMPYVTEVSTNTKTSKHTRKAGPFNPIDDQGLITRIQTSWGHISIYSRDASPVKYVDSYLYYGCILISQGVAVPLPNLLPYVYKGINEVVAFARSGEVDLKLPDRDSLLQTERNSAIIRDVYTAVIDSMIRHINDTGPNWQQYAEHIYAKEPDHIIDIKPERRVARIGSDCITFESLQLALDEKSMYAVKDDSSHNNIFPLYNGAEPKQVSIATFKDRDVQILGKFLTNLEVYDSHTIYLTQDPRCDYIYKFDKVEITHNDECVQILTPESNSSRLIKYDCIENVKIRSSVDEEYEEHRILEEYGCVLLHTSGLNEPISNLDDMEAWYDQDWEDNAEDEWNTSEINTAVRASQSDVFVTHGTPAEINKSIHYHYDFNSYRIENAVITFNYNTVRIDSGVLVLKTGDSERRLPFANGNIIEDSLTRK